MKNEYCYEDNRMIDDEMRQFLPRTVFIAITPTIIPSIADSDTSIKMETVEIKTTELINAYQRLLTQAEEAQARLKCRKKRTNAGDKIRNMVFF